MTIARRDRPKAVGLVRPDISESNTPRHAAEIRYHAARSGYNHIYTAQPPIDYPDPVGYALGLASGLGVDALIVFDLATVDHTPSRVCEMFDLETVNPPETWTAAVPGIADPAHAHPEQPLTLTTSRLIMQHHVECRAIECPRKASAYNFLVRAGKIVPPIDTPRERAAARGVRFQSRNQHTYRLPLGVTSATLRNILAALDNPIPDNTGPNAAAYPPAVVSER